MAVPNLRKIFASFRTKEDEADFGRQALYNLVASAADALIECLQILGDSQWNLCLDSWTAITSIVLRLSDAELSSTGAARESVDFLLSYLHERRLELSDELSDDSRRLSSCVALSRNVLLLTCRLLSNSHVPQELSKIDFLLDFVAVYAGKNITKVKNSIEAVLRSNCDSIEEELETIDFANRTETLCMLIAISDIGTLLMKAKIARELCKTYEECLSQRRPLLRMSWLLGKNEHVTMKFLDALMSLQTTPNPLANDLLSRTTMLHDLRHQLDRRPELEDFLNELEHRKIPPATGTQDRGKGRVSAFEESQNDAAELMSRISQIQDLFPDFGSGFVEECLTEYAQDVETTIMHLLEEDLPPRLAAMDRDSKSMVVADVKQPARRDVPDVPDIPQRANIYDGDDFDRLEFGNAKVRQGRRLTVSADTMLSKPISSDHKMKVLSLAFDPDDDELDDTYDQFEGGPVPDLHTNDELDEAAKPDVPNVDDMLFLAHESEPSLFDRAARKSAGRQDLRARTNLSDEQIEGWKAMLDREPARARRLADKYAFSGKQSDVQSTRWQSSNGEDGEGGRSSGDRGRGRGRGNGRGRGRGRGGQTNASGEGNKGKGKSPDEIKRERAKKESRGSGRGRARGGGGMRGTARLQG